LKKFDLSHLNAYDNLRRDYKEYTYEITSTTSQSTGKVQMKAGLSTVPLPLDADWAANGQLLKFSLDRMTTRNLAILGVLTGFHKKSKKKTGKGKHKREMAWFVRSSSDMDSVDLDVLSERLFSGLEADKDLELKKHKHFIVDLGDRSDLRVRVYKQQNADISRKGIAPLLQRIMEEERS
jgi:exopolyphosphatase